MFSKFTKKFSKATNVATYRSMNKANAKINTAWKRNLAKDTGLKSKDIAKRTWVKKANSKKLTASTNVGTKYAVPLDLFKAKPKTVKVGKRKYQGVTAVLPQESRALVPGAFFMTKGGRTLVMKRRSKARMSLERMKVNLYSTAKMSQPQMIKALREEYRLQYSQQLKYELNK